VLISQGIIFDETKIGYHYLGPLHPNPAIVAFLETNNNPETLEIPEIPKLQTREPKIQPLSKIPDLLCSLEKPQSPSVDPSQHTTLSDTNTSQKQARETKFLPLRNR